MTALLERAITQARQLPEPAQNAVAAMILEELEDEMRWDSIFANSQDILAKLSEEALGPQGGTRQWFHKLYVF